MQRQHFLAFSKAAKYRRRSQKERARPICPLKIKKLAESHATLLSSRFTLMILIPPALGPRRAGRDFCSWLQAGRHTSFASLKIWPHSRVSRKCLLHPHPPPPPAFADSIFVCLCTAGLLVSFSNRRCCDIKHKRSNLYKSTVGHTYRSKYVCHGENCVCSSYIRVNTIMNSFIFWVKSLYAEISFDY